MSRFLELMLGLAAFAACLGIAVAGTGCGGESVGERTGLRFEGTEPGDCIDDADNDADGLFDCSDPGCAGAATCSGGGTGGIGGSGGIGGTGGMSGSGGIGGSGGLAGSGGIGGVAGMGGIGGSGGVAGMGGVGGTGGVGGMGGIGGSGGVAGMGGVGGTGGVGGMGGIGGSGGVAGMGGVGGTGGEGCGGRCGPDEVCEAGECCEPTYPCAANECSPPGGFPDGCGGITQCPECRDGEDCVLSNELVFECLGDCTCEAQGVECGNATICGSPTLCGTCADNGFDEGYRCQSGRCVCKDPFEVNDSLDQPSLICGAGAGPNCMQDAWGIDVQATLHHSQDVDYYVLQVLDSPTPILAQTFGGGARRLVQIAYLCSNGDDGLKNCSGWEEEIEDIRYCVSGGDAVAIERGCDSGSSSESETATVLVRVESEVFEGECDPYQLQVLATFSLP